MRRPFRMDKLRLAMEANGFDYYNQLAAKSGVSHATFSRLQGEAFPQVTSRTLERLAQTLRVPEEWLSGEREHLPFEPPHGIIEEDGHFRLSEATEPEWLTASKIRLSWLLRQVDAALRRDLKMWFGDKASRAYLACGDAMLLGFASLADHSEWENYAGGVTTVAWLEGLVKPWLAGDAPLRTQLLHDLLIVQRNNSESTPSPIIDQIVPRAIEFYDNARQEHMVS